MAKSNINEIAQGIVENTEFETLNIKELSNLNPEYLNVIVYKIPRSNITIIEKDDIKIVIGENIDISKQNKKIEITKDLNINVGENVNLTVNGNLNATIKGKSNINSTGDINLKAEEGTIIMNSKGSSNWSPNAITHCIFSGTPHGGENLGVTNLKGES